MLSDALAGIGEHVRGGLAAFAEADDDDAGADVWWLSLPCIQSPYR